MKRLLTIASLLVVLSACGIFKSSKSTKVSHERDSLFARQTESSTKLAATSTSIDTGKTVITETTESTFYSPRVKAKGSYAINPSDLLSQLSRNYFTLDTAMVRVSVHYNALDSTFNIELDKLPEQGNARTEKRTEIKNGLSETSNTIAEGKSKTNEQTKVSTKTSAEEKATKPDYSWLAWLAGIIALLISIRFIYNKLKLRWKTLSRQ